MKRLMLIACALLIGACTPYSCPTYSQSKWDTIPATHSDLALFMAQDTTANKFSFAEKALAVVVIAVSVTAITQDRSTKPNTR